jgi:hypothetical protein
MELTFNKTSNGFIAEYSATTHFNLHIEGGDRVLLYKRTSGEKGDLLANIPSHGVVDIDIAVNFEVTYEIHCDKMPDVAVITEKS